jgi:HEAT repeat protein
LVALRSEKSNVRDEAFKQIEDTRNSKVLVIFLRETEEVYVQDYIIGQCINLLAELEGIKSIQLLSGQQRNIERTVRALTKPNLSAIEELIALAQNEKSEPWLRNAIVISLANSADPHAEAFLIQVLEEDASYPALKTNIMYGLVRIGSQSAINAIVREFLTGGSNGTMNYTALDPLEKLNALDRLLEPLLDSLDNFDDWLPHRLEALRKIGDKRAIQPLVAALEKAPAGYDRIIRQTLQKLGYEE